MVDQDIGDYLKEVQGNCYFLFVDLNMEDWLLVVLGMGTFLLKVD